MDRERDRERYRERDGEKNEGMHARRPCASSSFFACFKALEDSIRLGKWLLHCVFQRVFHSFNFSQVAIQRSNHLKLFRSEMAMASNRCCLALIYY